MQGATWHAEIELIDRPKPKPVLIKDTLVKLLRETAKDPSKVVRIPKRRQGSTQAAYYWARQYGCRHHIEGNGDYLYLWWTARPGRPKGKKG